MDEVTFIQNQVFLFLFPMDDNAIPGCIIKCEQFKVTVYGKIPGIPVICTTELSSAIKDAVRFCGNAALPVCTADNYIA
jgi:hypothetical protein